MESGFSKRLYIISSLYELLSCILYTLYSLFNDSFSEFFLIFLFLFQNVIANSQLDSNYTRMLRAILNKSWMQHLTKTQLYGHLQPIKKTHQVRRTRHAGHCWRSKDEPISDILPWTPSHGRTKTERPARTYIQQFCADTGCSLEDLLGAMNDRKRCR